MEKTFLYLLLISIVLHVAGFAALYFWPKEQHQQISEPTFIDLQDVPELKTPPPQQPVPKARPSDQRRRVARETAPRLATPVTPPAKTPSPRQSARAQSAGSPGRPGQTGAPAKPSEAGSSVNELLRRKPQQQAGTGGGGGTKPQPNLAPSASRMARLEENYRRRFADDIDDGTTRFLNTDDIQFGSFLRRFETAVYGVWRYPQEAALKGIEGVTPVKITFNRNGEIVKVQLLESSGSRILDDEVFRTLRLIGPMGNFPKTYGKDEFNLIAFFQYGNARSRLR
ncbi:TonB family protein [Trichlorobacter lovleyi]|uniref:cell envelope integrity protein TolA n=1 Tax=Trichlorobacter lovleyi TaxID=313985 RepID=UPI00247FF005|nr:TonB family protein [Trichlorobacter lovleyi]